MAEAAAGRTSSSGDDDDAPPAAPAPEDPDYSKALSRAMRLINFRERAAGELVKRLLEDGYSLQVAGRVVARMQELVSLLS
jgi:SOS response regulatory protein OraA/RecX